MAQDPLTRGLEDNIESFKNKIYEGDAISSVMSQIVAQFLPLNEIVKKIIAAKNPFMKKEDIDLMVDGKKQEEQPENRAAEQLGELDKQDVLDKNVAVDLESAVFPPEEKLDESEEEVEEEIPENETEDQRAKRIERRNKRKAERQKRKEQAAEKAKELRTQLKEEAKKIIEEVKKAIFKMLKEQKELIGELVNTVIALGVSIPAAVGAIAPTSFNVPLAIKVVLGIIETINAIAKRFADVIDNIEPLKQLKLLLPDEAYQIITLPLNIAIIILEGLYTPIFALKKGIDAILEFILKLISPLNLSTLIGEITKLIKKKEKERDNSDDQDDIDSLNIEIASLKGRLTEIEKGFDITFTEDDLKKYDQTKDIQKEIEQVQKLANDIKYVYDVKLPDGRTLVGLTLEELEEIKERYDVVFNNQQIESN